ncbi:MAG: NADPH dehydrogenase NamA [Sulfurimonas sp.]|nr:NADPH dehydrogenase NamA [Sulfurimonas sp.]
MLFEKTKIRNLELKNRVIMAPMCIYSAKADGKVTPFHIEHYVTRAVGGVGLILSEAIAVSPEGRISDKDLGIWNDEQIAGLKNLTDRVHQYNCKIGIQIAHAGRKCECSDEPLAPSKLRFSDDYNMPKEISIKEIKLIKQEFLDAIKRSVLAGFDMIELHGAHGYFINQMLSPFTNKREDEYGGSFENRNRFLLEVIKEAREFYDGVIFVRLSAVDYEDTGFSMEDCINLSKELKKLDVDLIDVSTGGNSVNYTAKIYPGYQIQYAKTIKEKVNIPTSAVGMIDTYELAKHTLNQGDVDFVLLGRELLRNPYWVVNNAKKYENLDLMNQSYTRAY